jgi:NACalpha-BTF3-like transcription factor
VRSDLSRDKRLAEESIQLVRNQTQVDSEDVQELRSRNRKLAATIRKYKTFVDNFDAEEDEESG